ncbi:nucleoside 2-deoxyribosyltransferase [Nocardioides marinus]|nr:nucleoside 2-deoxyribosyltransferase [Nocardioides marinus]
MQSLTEILGTQDIILIIGTVGVTATILIALMSFQLRSKQLKLEEKRLSVEIEMMRRSFEHKLYDLNNRLTQNSDRWSDVNHLLVEGASSFAKGDHSHRVQSENQFLKNLGITAQSSEQKTRKAFILTPFHERFSNDYETISKALRNVGYEVSRGDETFLEGNILRHIVTEISTSALIVANIDGRNPNVFYELGIAHALGKRVIIVTSSLDDVPFDLRNHLLLFWKTPDQLTEELHKSLARLGLLEK